MRYLRQHHSYTVCVANNSLSPNVFTLGFNSIYSQQLLKHMTNHRKILRSLEKVCHICGKSNLRRMKEHIRGHRKAGHFKCPYCDKGFNRQRQFHQHQRIHTGERPFVCEMCAYTFTSAGGLQRHRKLHNISQGDGIGKKLQRQRTQTVRPTAKKQAVRIPRDKIVCPLCQGLFINRSSIFQHLKLMHSLDGPAEWKRMLDTVCMVCHKVCATNVELIAHKLEHSLYECNICKRRFDNKLTLKYHVEAHSTKERPHKCEVMCT